MAWSDVICVKCGLLMSDRGGVFVGRDPWHTECHYYEVKAQLAAAEALLDSRAGKLLRKGKTFVVVAVDEPYFMHVFDLIRKQEMHKGRWTDADQAWYERANEEVNAIYEAKAGGQDAETDN